jgi:two-component system cell cycle response regulator
VSTQKQKAAVASGDGDRVVLVVDDDSSIRALVALWLSKVGLRILEASSGEEAVDVVAAAPDAIDAVLLDIMMPGMDGFEVLRRLKEEPRSSRIPIVFLSASDAEADVVRGVKGGAIDYLHKPFSGPILVTKVQAVVERRRAERALEDRLRSAEENATHDVLTGLANRRDFEQRITEMVANAVRHHEPLALLMIDIDEFKSINDAFGHAVGDKALKHLAAKLRGVTRAGDQAFRYGGDEFVLLLQRCDRAGAAAIFDRLRESLSNAPLELEGGKRVPFSFSGGISSMEADNAFRLVDLVGRADAALYVAKGGGRDRVAVEVHGTPAEGKPKTAHDTRRGRVP